MSDDVDDDMDDDVATGEAAESATKRSWLPTTLIVVATVVAVVSTLTTWVRAQLLDTDDWTEVSSELLAEPEVQAALSTYLANQLFERVDLQSEFAELLPAELSRLAGPLTGVLREPVTNGIDRLVASDRFATLWQDANRIAHARMVAILRGETAESVSTDDGTVTLDLGTLLRNVGERLGIPEQALDRLPPDAGQVVIFESDELSSAQTAVQILDFLSWFLFIVVVALYASAVYLARGRRVTTLRNVGLAIAAGGVALLFLRAIGVRATVGVVVENPANEALATVVADVATELLRQSAWTGIVYGVLVAAFAFLLGDHRWAVAVRRQLGRASEAKGVAIAGAVLFVLLLIWWSPGHSFDHVVTALVFIVLSIAAVVALATVVGREHRALTESG